MEKLAPEVQEFIWGKLADGECQSVEEVVEAALLPLIKGTVESGPTQAPSAARVPLIGRFATSEFSISEEEIDEARREAWADFPRQFPDPYF